MVERQLVFGFTVVELFAMSAEEGVREHDTSFMYYLSSCHVDKLKPHA